MVKAVQENPPIPRGEGANYYFINPDDLSARERIRRSIKQIASTEPTDSAFATRIGVPRSYVCNWKAGKSGVDTETLDRIAKTYSISMEDIFAGTACITDYEAEQPSMCQVPCYGSPSRFIAFPKSVAETLAEDTELFAWEMNDTSMCHLVPKGANVLLSAQDAADNPTAPYLCKVDTELVLRKVTTYSAGYLLSPDCDDPTVDPLLIKGAALETFSIIGKVVWYSLPAAPINW